MGLGVARGQESWDRIETALGRNWMVMEPRRAGKVECEGACQAGGGKNELETLRNVSRPGAQETESSQGLGGGQAACPCYGHTTTQNTACSSKRSGLLLKSCVSIR